MIVGGGPLLLKTGLSQLSDLFSGGDQGLLYEFDDKSTLFQDESATTPVTASGQEIHRVNDKSGNGNDAIKAAAGYQPTYTESGGAAYSSHSGDGFYIPDSKNLFNYIHEDSGWAVAVLVNASFNGSFVRLIGNCFTSSELGANIFLDDRDSASTTDTKNGVKASVFKASSGSTLYTIQLEDTIPQNISKRISINCPSGGPLELKIDNSASYTAAKNGSAVSGNSEEDFSLGCIATNPSSFPLVGSLYAVIIRDKEFSQDELDFIDNQFLDKL